MRLHEIISESKTKIRKDTRHSLPNMRVHPDLDNSSPYKAYRYGVAMAGAPTQDMNQDGPIGQKMVTVGYTEADDEIVQAADKLMNSKSQQVTSDGSEEVPLVNNTSPVAKQKRNKYGI